QAVPVHHVARKQIGHGRQTDVWMRANVYLATHSWWEIEGPHMVEEDEWTHHALLGKRQHTAHFQTAAEAASPLLNDHLYHSSLLIERRHRQHAMPGLVMLRLPL